MLISLKLDTMIISKDLNQMILNYLKDPGGKNVTSDQICTLVECKLLTSNVKE